MRILVTKQGNIIIQEIDDAMPLYTQNMHSTSKFRGYSTDYPLGRSKNFKMNSLSRTNNKLKRTPIRQIYRNLEDTEITKEEMQSAKQIKLNERKITFPKQFAEKYESDIMNSQNNNIINSSNNFLPSLTNNNMNSNLEKDFQTPLDSKRNKLFSQTRKIFIFNGNYSNSKNISNEKKNYKRQKNS